MIGASGGVAPLAWLLQGVATVYFFLMIWISARFFVVADGTALFAKGCIAVVGVGNSLLVTWLLVTMPSAEAMVWPSLALFCYAVVALIWAWVANWNRPLDFLGSSRPPQNLNRSGPYRFVRHPFYSSYCAAWLASCLATHSPVVVAASALLCGCYLVSAFREERQFVAGPLQAEYRAYQRTTWMLLPRLRWAS